MALPPIYHCHRCGHDWAGRPGTIGARRPKVCPRCKNPNWDRERTAVAGAKTD